MTKFMLLEETLNPYTVDLSYFESVVAQQKGDYLKCLNYFRENMDCRADTNSIQSLKNKLNCKSPHREFVAIARMAWYDVHGIARSRRLFTNENQMVFSTQWVSLHPEDISVRYKRRWVIEGIWKGYQNKYWKLPISYMGNHGTLRKAGHDFHMAIQLIVPEVKNMREFCMHLKKVIEPKTQMNIEENIWVRKAEDYNEGCDSLTFVRHSLRRSS